MSTVPALPLDEGPEQTFSSSCSFLAEGHMQLEMISSSGPGLSEANWESCVPYRPHRSMRVPCRELPQITSYPRILLLTACYSRPVSHGIDLSGGWIEFSQNGRTQSLGKREKVMFWACTEERAERRWLVTQAVVPGLILVEAFWKSKHQVLSSKH